MFSLGHSRSVDCLAVDPTKQYVASGSFDSQLKIWSANLSDVDDAVTTNEEGSSESKKAKKAPTRTPLVTLTGHKEGVAGVTWLDSATEVVSASWDHTIRIWDAEMQSLKTELVGNKAFFDVAYSPEKKMLLTAASERTIRLYDPRSTEGLIVKSAYSSHQVIMHKFCNFTKFLFKKNKLLFCNTKNFVKSELKTASTHGRPEKLKKSHPK